MQVSNNYQNSKQYAFQGAPQQKIFMDALKVADLKIALKGMKATRTSKPLDDYFAQTFEKLRLRFSPNITKSSKHEFTFNSNGDVITISKKVNKRITMLAYRDTRTVGKVVKRDKLIAYYSSTNGLGVNIARNIRTLLRFPVGAKLFGRRTGVLETLNKDSKDFGKFPVYHKSEKHGPDVSL